MPGGQAQPLQVVGYHVRQTPELRNTVIMDLLSDGRFMGAVLKFLESTRVEEVKVGVLNRG